MARRLFMLWVAIISLVLMAQVMPGLANPYDLESDGDTDWVEMFPEYSTPGSLGSTFIGSHYWGDSDENLWEIGDISVGKPLTNSVAATQEDLGGGRYRFTYTYDAFEDSIGQIKFKVSIPIEGVEISSTNAQITITAEYIQNGDAWTYQQRSGIMEGTGINSLDEQPFTFSGILFEGHPDHIHWGYFENFKLTYPASAVPLPGSVWLLSTGILGIWCLGRRRKE